MKSSPNSLVESQPVRESVTSSSTEKFEIRYKSKDLTFGKIKRRRQARELLDEEYLPQRPRFASMLAKLPQAVNASTVPNEKSFTISRLLTMVSATPSLQLRRRICQKRQMKTSPNRLVEHQPARYLFTFINGKSERRHLSHEMKPLERVKGTEASQGTAGESLSRRVHGLQGYICETDQKCYQHSSRKHYM